MFRSTLITALLVTGPIAVPAARADDKVDKEGWVPLFNGKDLTGWKIHPMPNKEVTEISEKKVDGKVVAFEGTVKGKKIPLWRVEDGTIIGGGPASHLFSERGDYDGLPVTASRRRSTTSGNSGQYFRTAFGPGFPTGYEAQINATHGDPVKTGSLYPDPRTTLKNYRDKITVLDTAPHKPDEWFTQEVIGGRATTSPSR